MRATALCSISLLVLSGILLSPATFLANSIDDDIRIDVPADGHVRVENRSGGVTAEVWQNTYVSVSAQITGKTRGGQSPIVLDNRSKTLSISINRALIGTDGAVDLVIRIPATLSVEVVTASGNISFRGLTVKTTLRSSSGNIETSFDPATSPTIVARTTQGAIKSDLSAQPDPSGHSLNLKGEGARNLNVETQSGQIVFKSGESTRVASEPLLKGPGGSKPAGTPATEASNDELSEGDVIRVDSQLVTVNMSVVDRSTNRGVMGLTQSDFRLFEDGEEQKVVQFDSASAPFDLLLVVDLSGSTRDVVKLIRAAALRFVDAARPADRIGVITFAGQATVISELTADRALLHDRLQAIDTARGDTKLYDAVDFAMTSAAKAPNKSRRSAIVLMSDGLDGTIPGVSGQTGSTLTYVELLRNIQEFDGVLYTLWLNTRYEALNPNDTQPEAFDEAYDRMKQMADAGGGIFYEVNKLTDLAGAYEQVVADLGTVYSLAYRPANKARDGKWRAIRININRSNAVARGKRGYYAN